MTAETPKEPVPDIVDFLRPRGIPDGSQPEPLSRAPLADQMDIIGIFKSVLANRHDELRRAPTAPDKSDEI
jgi:hypothetical protein